MSRRKKNRSAQPPPVLRFRFYVVLAVLTLACGALLARTVELQIIRKDFYQQEGDARYLRTVKMPASRGSIVDRNGEPLAVSTPVDSVWANPKDALEHPDKLAEVAQLLNQDSAELSRRLSQRIGREFVYLRRHVKPELSDQIAKLDAPGVSLQREYRRYYPAAETTAHVLGFTDIDDRGQEGLELAYDEWLSGEAGAKRVIKDSRGRIVEDVELVKPVRPGGELTLTMDRRIQYLAFRELHRSVVAHGAESGSVVVLDPRTSEVLAMANYPSFNPNGRNKGGAASHRNRAVTDFFEPGSVMKVFTIAAALESGKFTPRTRINTSPGWIQLGPYTAHDARDFGVLDVTGILTKSSNVGAVRMTSDLSAKYVHDNLRRFGFGRVTGSGFPGESPGLLSDHSRWREVEKSAISYGYGLAVTPLQLAQAFGVIANGGRMRAPTFVKGARNPAEAVIDPGIAADLRQMMETVIAPGGTGTAAKVAHFRVAGKTGTSRKASGQGYANQYVASFGGFAPATDPRVVVLVSVNDPAGEDYHGGDVAAPIFAAVAEGALRLMDARPDAPVVAGSPPYGEGES